MEQRQPLPRLGLGRRHLAATLTLAALALVLAACDSGEGSPTPTGTPSPTARATMSPHPGAIIITPVPPTERAAWDLPLEVHIVDVVERSAVDLLADWPDIYREDQVLMPAGLFPEFTANGTGVWLTFRPDDRALRFGLDGTVTREIPEAWGVHERADGGAYYQGMEAGEFRTNLFREWEPDAIALEGVWGSFSPDYNHSANTDYDPATRLSDLVVTDLSTGDRYVVAEDIGPCGCDGGPGLAWSPSGRFIAFGDFPYDKPAGPSVGAFVVDVRSGERTKISDDPWWITNAWAGPDEVLAQRDGRLVVLDLLTDTFTEPVTLDEPLLRAFLDPTGELLVLALGDVDDPITRIVDLASAAVKGEWEGVAAEVVSTPAGVVATFHGLTQQVAASECPVRVAHPALGQDACLDGMGWSRLSPDGRHIAVGMSTGIRIYDLESGAEPVYFHRTTRAYPYFQWNMEGTHLLISEGFGL